MKKKMATQEPIINQSLSYRLWRLNLEWQDTLRKRLAKLDLTYAEFVVLTILVTDINNPRKRTGLNQKYIRDTLKLNKKVISKTILSLENKGFVYRYEDMFDTRSFMVFPTVRGKTAFAQAYKVVIEFDKMQQARHEQRGN